MTVYQPAALSIGSWIYLLYAACGIALLLTRPWPRPVTTSRRLVTACVVAILLAGALSVGVTHSAVIDNPCDMFDGWLKSLCEWMP